MTKNPMTEKQYILAIQAWAILTFVAAQKQTMSYGDLCKGLGYSGNPKRKIGANNAIAGNVMRLPLMRIQQFCEEKRFPRLTSIVGKGPNHTPSEGYAGNLADLKKDRAKVHARLWFDDYQKFCKWAKRHLKCPTCGRKG